jgi:hypothetical protein
LPDDAYHRDIDFGKDIRRHPLDSHNADRSDQKSHHNECVSATQSKLDDPHGYHPLGRLRDRIGGVQQQGLFQIGESLREIYTSRFKK